MSGTSSLFRVTAVRGATLTQAGGWTQLALRLVGPVLFGLVVLSMRARVKR
jgi:hypothetical protein